MSSCFGPENLSCQSSCSITLNCTGDSVYCSLFDCDPDSPCWCSLINYTSSVVTSDLSGNIASIINKTTYITYSSIDPIKKDQVFGYNLTSSQKKRYFIGSCPIDIEPLLSGFDLYNSMSNVTLYISYDTFNQWLTVPIGSSVVGLPISSAFSLKSIVLRFFQNEDLICDLRGNTLTFNLCYIPTCVFCSDFFNSQCVSSSTRQALIALLVVTILLSILFLLLAFFVIWKRQRFIQFLKMMKDSTFSMLEKNKSISMTDIFNKTFVMLSLITLVSGQCSNEILLSSNLITCSYSGTDTTCVANINSLLTLRSIGSTSCLTLQEPQTGEPLVSIQITYNGAYYVCPLTTQYYTSDWSSVSTVAKVCPGAQYCTPNQNCNSFTSNNINAYGLLTGISTILPGQTQCLSTCGGFGCSCILFDNSCTYGRWAIKPTNDLYTVSNIQSCQFQADISVEVLDLSDNNSTLLYLNGLSTSYWGPFQFTFQGTLPTLNPNFMQNSIAYNGNKAYFSGSSVSGSPQLSLLGDIQAVSLYNLQNPSINSFQYPFNICSGSSSGSNFVANCAKSGITNMKSSAQVFPFNTSVGMFSYSQAGLTVALTSPPTLVVSMVSPQYTFVKDVSIVCPEVSNFAPHYYDGLTPVVTSVVSGCYSCPQGFDILIDAQSTCAEGLADVQFIPDDGYTGIVLSISTVYLTNSYEFYNIHGSSQDSEISGILNITFANNFVQVQVFGSLAPPEIYLDNSTSTTGSNASSNITNSLSLPSNVFNDWWNSLIPSIPWMKWFILGLVIIAILVILFLSICACIRC
jgi:hypothetical protein